MSKALTDESTKRPRRDQIEWSGSGCDENQEKSNIGFGDSSSIELAPGCCITITFNPALRDELGGADLTVTTDPVGADVSVSELGGTALKRNGPDGWDIPSWHGTAAKVKICAGAQPVKIRAVRANFQAK